MHNGCLLLLAFVAVFQPIASYTERGLVDGRQQRCDYRTSVRDPGLNFHGTYRFNNPTVEDRRLNHKDREIRRNEVREESLRIASDRRLAGTVERDSNTLTRLSGNRIGDVVLRRENREARRYSGHREELNREVSRDRLSRSRDTNEAHIRGHRDNSRLAEDENRFQRIDNIRRFNDRVLSVESRRNEIDSGALRFREPSEIRVEANRGRENEAKRLNERRIAREAVQRMDRLRSANRIQLDRDDHREILDRRSSKELRSLSTGDRDNRVSGNRDSRLATRDTTSLDRNDRRTTSSQRLGQLTRRDTRVRVSVDRRNIRDTADRMSENNGDAKRFQRVQSADSRRENQDSENKAVLVRAVRSLDNRLSRNDRSGSRILQRVIAAENQRDAWGTPTMARTRSVESRSLERVLDNRRDNRNIERESRQTQNNIHVAEIRNAGRDSRLLDLTLKRSADLRKSNRRTCVPSQTRRERVDENRRLSTNIDSQTFKTERSVEELRTERTDESRRDARKVAAQAIRTERINENRQDVHKFGIPAFRTERTDESRRYGRTVGVRLSRTQGSQQDTRNIEVRTFRNARADESKQDSPSMWIRSLKTARADVVRAFSKEGSDESQRHVRIVGVRSFRSDLTEESRQDSRELGIRAFRSKRSVERYSPNAEIPAFRTERFDESRERMRDARIVRARTFRTGSTDVDDARIFGLRMFRTDRTDESRRVAGDIGIRSFRLARSDETHRDARNFEVRGTGRQSRSLDRATDSRWDSRNDNRGTSRMQERTLESRRTARKIELRTQDVRANNRNARSLERENHSIGRQRSVASRLNERMVIQDLRTHLIESQSTDRRARATDNHRDLIRNVHKEIRTLEGRENKKVESRRVNLVKSGDDVTRKTDRASERLNKRDSLDSRRTYTLERESRRDTHKLSERNNVDGRHAVSRNGFDSDIARTRDHQSVIKNPPQTENEAPLMNWPYIFYTLQGLYVCGLLMQFNIGGEKKTRVSWWPASQHLIKVE